MTGPLKVTVSGPFFAGTVPRQITAMLDEATYAVAGQALADVQFNLDRSIRHPTPYYETQIVLERAGQDQVVHDRGIVYGPWLEGISSRNQATRFKGYHAFRRATQSVARKATRIIDSIARRHTGAMN